MPKTAARAAGVEPLDSPIRRRLPPLLRAAWYGLNQSFRRRLAHLGMTPDQFTVLRTLGEHEGVTQRQLAVLMSSDPNTVASLVARMEGAGLIERRPHARDRRAHSLRAKAAGRRKFAEARRIAVALQVEVLTVVPENERERFLEHLERLAAACRTSGNRNV